MKRKPRMRELYKKHRPRKFADVVGQPRAVAALESMVAAGEVPHSVLFAGPSGTGKTTLARILARELGCGKNFKEINAAESRGIDSIREVQSVMGLAPMGGKCRVWLWDEAHRLTPDSQSALLKTLEDTPSHVYFML